MPLPAIPPIVDAPRVVSTTVTVGNTLTTLAFGFPVFGAQEDLTVTLNGTVLDPSLWAFTSSSGTPLALLPLPITDGIVTFTPALTPSVNTNVKIWGTWQPRQVIVPTAPGITRREFEQAISTLIASNRELLTLIQNLQANPALPWGS